MNALGISVSEIEGIFHTHSHDDHFAGLPTLMQTDHRIRYFATPLVRAAVTKKLTAMLGVAEREFEHYFDVQDLAFDQWNKIGGLEVRPIFSPHPVETTCFYFRAMGPEGYKTYGHMADIASFSVLESMVTDDETAPGMSEARLARTKYEYHVPTNVKKIDIGGGLIHGAALDFKDDPSERIIWRIPTVNIRRKKRKSAPVRRSVRLTFSSRDIKIMRGGLLSGICKPISATPVTISCSCC